MKRILFSGFFDLLHLGHIMAFKEAKKFGDFLVVHVASDKEAKAVKGKNRPIIPGEERAELIRELKCVDEVFYTETYMTEEEIIEKTKADIIIRNEDFIGGFDISVVRFPRFVPKSGLDTTKIIKKIKDMPEDQKELAGINYILKVKDEILLQRRDNNPGIRCSGKLVIPGGKREIGENPHLAAVREMKEETNVEIHPNNFDFICDFTYPWGETNRFFLVNVENKPSIQNLEGKFEWWNINKIPKLCANQNKVIELYL